MMAAGGPATTSAPPSDPIPHGAPRGVSAQIEVQRLPHGMWRVSPALIPAHVAVARTPQEFTRAVVSCFTELDCVAYARRRGVRPDISMLSSTDSFEEPTNLGGKPVAPSWGLDAPAGDKRAAGRAWASGGRRERDPADYTANADGSWTSPSGRRVTDPERVRQIVRRRTTAGLSTLPDDSCFDLTSMASTIAGASSEADVSPWEWLSRAVSDAARPAPVEAPPAPAQLSVVRGRRDRRRREADGQLALPLVFGDESLPAVAA